MVSLNSVLRYRETDKPTPEVAKELGVNYLLEYTFKETLYPIAQVKKKCGHFYDFRKSPLRDFYSML